MVGDLHLVRAAAIQGSILGPIMFIIDYSDLSIIIALATLLYQQTRNLKPGHFIKIHEVNMHWISNGNVISSFIDAINLNF
jgi:mannose/fructose/N-acetylgalactosamine-specific phosphotransferase system component IID